MSYGRLCKACQTDVDDTSIDTLKTIAGDLGLGAVQMMLPVDHLWLSTAQALPSLVPMRQPKGDTPLVMA